MKLSLVALFMSGIFLSAISQAADIKVFKSDGSKQCGEKGVALDVMGKTLTHSGVNIICGQKGHTGSMNIQMCGAETGAINIYQINAKDIKKAKQLGFNSVVDLPDYQDAACKAKK